MWRLWAKKAHVRVLFSKINPGALHRVRRRTLTRGGYEVQRVIQGSQIDAIFITRYFLFIYSIKSLSPSFGAVDLDGNRSGADGTR